MVLWHFSCTNSSYHSTTSILQLCAWQFRISTCSTSQNDPTLPDSFKCMFELSESWFSKHLQQKTSKNKFAAQAHDMNRRICILRPERTLRLLFPKWPKWQPSRSFRRTWREIHYKGDWFGGWTTHLKNICSSNWIISSQNRGEHEKYLKPPPRLHRGKTGWKMHHFKMHIFH